MGQEESGGVVLVAYDGPLGPPAAAPHDSEMRFPYRRSILIVGVK